jgi:comEA protein
MANRPKRLIAALLLAFGLLAPGTLPAAEEQQKININTASAQDLTSLRGIGEKTAEAIVEYRESHGPFKSVEELVEVRGIGEKLMASLRDSVTVGAAANAPPPKAKPGS